MRADPTRAAALPARPLTAAALGAALAALGACAADPLPTAPHVPRPARAAGSPSTAGDNVALRWNDALLRAVRATRLGPPAVARAIAVAHTAMYDAWAAYDPAAVGTQYHAERAERTAEDKPRAVSFAAYRALTDLFPSQDSIFRPLMTELGYDPADASAGPDDAAGVGTAAAEAVLAVRRGDGSNQTGGYADNASYAPFNRHDRLNDPTRWQPLWVDGGEQQFLLPQWPRVVPFALRDGAQFRPPPPRTTTSNGGYVQQVEDMLHTSAGLTDEEKAVAEYWSDGPSSETPPGHWCLIAAWVSRRDRHGLDEDVRMFFALGNAELDAGIAAWDAKRAYDAARPITSVHYWKAGKPVRAWGGPGRGTVKMRGEQWQPYIATPPFSEYVSGHSTFSAAAATVLAAFTGSDAFGASVAVDTLRVERVRLRPAVTLSWPTFTDAADEAGMSRRYGGIHFAEGDLAGRALGRRVGAAVWAKAAGYWTGQPAAALVATR